MIKSIEELKLLIVDGMILKSKNGNQIEIRRYPNNIIKMYNKSVTWNYLQDILENSDYFLIINEIQEDLNFKKKSNWGGRRLPGPGKQLGRPKKDIVKKAQSFRLSEDSIIKLNELSKFYNKSKSQFIESLILEESSSFVKQDKNRICKNVHDCLVFIPGN